MVISLEDGRRLRVLARDDPAATIGGAGYPRAAVVSADDRYVYFQRGPQGECDVGSEIYRVPVNGGSEEIVAAGRNPTVSPDGHNLAYVRVPADPHCVSDALAVRDLATGAERVWTNPSPFSSQDFRGLAWAPDSRHLDVEFDNTGGDISGRGRLVDTSAPGGLLDAPAVPDARVDIGLPIAFLSDGRLAFAPTPTTPSPTRGPSQLGGDVKVVDRPGTRTIGAPHVLFRLPPGEIRSLAADPTGTGLLVTEVAAAGPEVPVRSLQGDARVYRWEAGRLRAVADGVSAVAWLPGKVHAPRVTSALVPTVLGLDSDQARRTLTAAGFPMISSERLATSILPGPPTEVVAEQRPEPGKRQTKGQPVRVVLAPKPAG